MSDYQENHIMSAKWLLNELRNKKDSGDIATVEIDGYGSIAPGLTKFASQCLMDRIWAAGGYEAVGTTEAEIRELRNVAWSNFDYTRAYLDYHFGEKHAEVMAMSLLHIRDSQLAASLKEEELAISTDQQEMHEIACAYAKETFAIFDRMTALGGKLKYNDLFAKDMGGQIPGLKILIDNVGGLAAIGRTRADWMRLVDALEPGSASPGKLPEPPKERPYRSTSTRRDLLILSC